MKSLEDGLAEFYAAQTAGDEPNPVLMIETGRPHASLSMKVHPKLRQQAEEHAAKFGVPTHFDRLGRPVFTSRSHQKRFLKMRGVVNLDGGYGD